MRRAVWGLITVILLGGASALLWLTYGFIDNYRMFGSSMLPVLVHFAAAVSAAALAVILIGQAALRFGVARMLRNDPTELQRSLVFALLTFIAAALVLAHLGFDLTTIVTTSAIMTAVVGLSVQPLATGLLSGMTLDRVMRIGDAVMLEGQPVEVLALNWRSVTGRRADGSKVTIPNTQLANSALTVLPRDTPHRAGISFNAPIRVAPHRLQQIAAAVISDFPEVDATKPVLLRPAEPTVDDAASRYELSFWVRHYAQRQRIEGEVRRRLWYAFRREKIDAGDELSEKVDGSLVSAVAAALRITAKDNADATALAAHPERTLDDGEIIQFGDGERIAFPARLAGRAGLLVAGKVTEEAEGARDSFGRDSWLERIELALARYIGPYAGYVVRNAAAADDDITQICRRVADEIDDPQLQSAFIRELDPPRTPAHRLGFVFQPRSGEDQTSRTFHAIEHATILALPEPPQNADPSARQVRATPTRPRR